MQTLSIEQEKFINKVLSSEEQYHLLLGGAGTGKTSTVSKLMVKFAEAGHHILSLYPTHAAKAVGIERLREFAGNITVKSEFSEPGSNEQDDSVVYFEDGNYANFRTIHSLLGIMIRKSYGKISTHSIQDSGKFIDGLASLKVVDGREFAVFVDEVSMIPLPFITNQECEKEHPIIKAGGLVELLDRTGIKYRLIFTGDFNQLLPVKAPAKEFAEEFLLECVEVTRLTENHRSESRAIVELGEAAFNNRGVFPPVRNHKGVREILDREEFTEEYLDNLSRGNDTVALVYTNAARKYYENLAAEKINGEPDPIFEGNIVLSGTTKTAKTANGGFETVLYAQDRLEIVSKSPTIVIPGTEWSGNAIESPMVVVRRLLDHSMHSYFATMSVGERVSAAFTEYSKDVSKLYNKITKFADENPSHELEDLFDLVGRQSSILDDNIQLIENGSTAKSYYNKNWNWDDTWSAAQAAYDVAALIWAKYYYSVLESILPLKTTVAQTCHMAQGSGRDHVFVDLKDIRKCRDREEKRRLIYVACTRAKKSLTILR